MIRNLRPHTAACSVLVLGLLLLVGGCTQPTARITANATAGGYLGGVSLPKPYAMPDVVLTDANGQAYNLFSSPSKPVTLLFFGYAHCPDVCISVLANLARSLQDLDRADRDRVQVIFVTTDPARDHGQALRTYLDRFDPSFLGLSGEIATIKTAAGQVGVDISGWKKLPGGGYEVGHSAQVIGFDHASAVVLWTPGTTIGDLAHDVTLLVARSR